MIGSVSSGTVRDLIGKADLVSFEQGSMLRGPITDIVINESPAEGEHAFEVETEFMAELRDGVWTQFCGRSRSVASHDQVPSFSKEADGSISFCMSYIGRFKIIPHSVQETIDPESIVLKD